MKIRWVHRDPKPQNWVLQDKWIRGRDFQEAEACLVGKDWEDTPEEITFELDLQGVCHPPLCLLFREKKTIG